MSASKSCPACLKQWAGTFKFCPEDGALLIALSAADTVMQLPAVKPETATQAAMKAFNASDTVVVSAVRPIDTDEYASAPKEPLRASATASPVEHPSTGPKSRKVAPRLLNLEPVDVSATTVTPASASPIHLDAGARRELGLNSAPTVVLPPTAVESIVADSRAKSAQPFERSPLGVADPRVAFSAGVTAELTDSPPGQRPEVVPGRSVNRVDISTEAGRPDAVKREQAKPSAHGPAAVAPPPAARAPAEVSPRRGGPPDPTKTTSGNEPAQKGRTPAQTAPQGPKSVAQAARNAAQAAKNAPPAANKHAQDAPQSKKVAQAAPTVMVAQAPRASPPKGGGAAPGAAPRKRSDFSDTGWFMRPDLPVDAETGRVEVDPKAYVRDDSIPEEKRRRFSLRRKDEE